MFILAEWAPWLEKFHLVLYIERIIGCGSWYVSQEIQIAAVGMRSCRVVIFFRERWGGESFLLIVPVPRHACSKSNFWNNMASMLNMNCEAMSQGFLIITGVHYFRDVIPNNNGQQREIPKVIPSNNGQQREVHKGTGALLLFLLSTFALRFEKQTFGCIRAAYLFQNRRIAFSYKLIR